MAHEKKIVGLFDYVMEILTITNLEQFNIPRQSGLELEESLNGVICWEDVSTYDLLILTAFGCHFQETLSDPVTCIQKQERHLLILISKINNHKCL